MKHILRKNPIGLHGDTWIDGKGGKALRNGENRTQRGEEKDRSR